MAYNGLKMSYFTCLGTLNAPRLFSEKYIWDQLLTHFLICKAFGDFQRAKMGTGSKHAKNTCFRIPRGLRSFLKKIAPSGPC